MCKNLSKNMAATDTLAVHDPAVDPETLFDPPNPNIAVLGSAAEVARHSDLVFSMLKAPTDVAAAYDDMQTAVAGERPKVFVDCSTIDVATSLRTAWSMRANGGHIFVDAPVAGTTADAVAATLTFMVGASDDAATTANEGAVLETLRPALGMMGSRVVPCGAPGMGLIAKLCNNYILAVTNMATSEAFQVAGSLGLRLDLFTEIVNSSSGSCWSALENNPVPGINPTAPASRDYENGFYITHMLKDLGLALDAADQAGIRLLLGQPALEAYRAIEANPLFKTKDISSVYKYLDPNEM